MDNIKRFMTRKEAAEYTGLSYSYIRQGTDQGKIPHIKSGTKILVNVPLLIEKLNRESEENVNA